MAAGIGTMRSWPADIGKFSEDSGVMKPLLVKESKPGSDIHVVSRSGPSAGSKAMEGVASAARALGVKVLGSSRRF